MKEYRNEFVKDVKRYVPMLVLAGILTFSASICEIISPIFMQKILDDGIIGKSLQLIFLWAAVLLGLEAIHSILDYLYHRVCFKIQKDYIVKTKEKVFDKIFSYSFRDCNQSMKGKLMNIFETDVEYIANTMTSLLFQIFSGMVVAFSAIVLLLMLDWQLFILIVFIQIILVICNKKMSVKIDKKINQYQKMNDNQSQRAQDIIGNLTYIIKSNCTKYNGKRYMDYEASLQKTSVEIDQFYIVNGILSSVLYTITELVVWGIGGYKVCLGLLTIGKLYQISSYSGKFAMPIVELIDNTVTFKRIDLAIKRIYGILAKKTVIGGEEDIKFLESIEFKDVQFSYGDKIILNSFHLSLEKNKLNVIVGESGTGKSTIINLLLGFCKEEKGDILVNSKDIGEYRITDLRDRISYMAQNAGIFNDNLKNNIYLGEMKESKEFHIILEKLGINELADSLEDGYDTVLEIAGSNISGGQCQKILLAREFYKIYTGRTDLLILDEPTSNMDNYSEKLIMECIEMIKHRATILLISHDLECVKQADIIYVLSEGKIVEKGTHEELLRHRGKYEKLCTVWNSI